MVYPLAENVLATLHHEATHGLAHVHQVQDTSRPWGPIVDVPSRAVSD